MSILPTVTTIPPASATISQAILAAVSDMRRAGTFRDGTALCWPPAELETLAMFAIDAKNKLANAEPLFVRVSPELVGQLRAEPSRPVTLEIQERDRGELHFVAREYACPKLPSREALEALVWEVVRLADGSNDELAAAVGSIVDSVGRKEGSRDEGNTKG